MNKKQIYTIAYALQLVMTILEGFWLFPLIWCIPMLKATKKAMDEVGTVREQPHIVLAVMSIFFTSIIAGALILIADLLIKDDDDSVFTPTTIK